MVSDSCLVLRNSLSRVVNCLSEPKFPGPGAYRSQVSRDFPSLLGRSPDRKLPCRVPFWLGRASLPESPGVCGYKDGSRKMVQMYW